MNGLGISEGIAIGKAFIYKTDEPEIPHLSVNDVVIEKKRFSNAVNNLTLNIKNKYEKASAQGDQDRADVFMAHEMIVNDPELLDGVNALIDTEEKCAEWALEEVSNKFIQLMEQLDDPYLRQRAGDIKDIRQQLLKLLLGISNTIDTSIDDSVIVIGREFNPSDIALTESKSVKGFLSEIGAPTTHFSILAKITNIPTVTNVSGILEMINEGDMLILDGTTGEIHIDPTKETIQAFQQKKLDLKQFNEKLKLLKDKPSQTADGVTVEIIGNIAGVNDAETMLELGAEGVGLFRTEFIYMDRSKAPTENEQYEIYKKVLLALEGKEVVIRTLDVGGDKEIPYLNMGKEDNPFLGYRAIRYCLNEKALFKTQIRAILRASVFGHAKIMIPMISTVDEVLDAKVIINECRLELQNEGVKIADTVEVGIMIEVPSAGIISDLLAEEVDFFSIGTNDLIQYTMAADRMNKDVAYLYHPYHPSFIRMLKMVIDNGHEKGIKIAMCGELASDPTFIPVLIGLGLDEFSMNGNAILKSRWLMQNVSKKEAQALVATLLTLKTSREIKETIEAFGDAYET